MSTQKLYDLGLEFKALKSLFDASNAYATKLQNFLKVEHFFNKATKALFEKADAILKSGAKSLPSFDILVDDTAFEDEVKDVLRQEFERTAVIRTDGDFSYIVTNLQKLALARSVYRTAYKAASDLTEDNKNEPIDLKPILDSLETTLLQAKQSESYGEKLILGRGYNDEAAKVHHQIIYAAESNDIIPSTWAEYDKESGGWERGNLVIVGANSGGGKTQFALNTMVRQYQRGYKVAVASYEMKAKELLYRVYANISEIEQNKIKLKKMTMAEQRKMECAYREFILQGHDKGNYFHVDCPTSEETVHQVGLRLYNDHKDNPPDVLIFDYINLLTTSSTFVDQQWQALGEIAREAKLLANALNVVVVLLAQIDDTYNLRYSKGIKDHANIVWGWIRDEQAKLDNIVTVKQLKVRNSAPFDFILRTKFEIGQFRDPDEGDKNKEYTDAEEAALAARFKELGFLFGEEAASAVNTAASPAAKKVLSPLSEDGEITADNLLEADYDSVQRPAQPILLTSRRK